MNLKKINKNIGRFFGWAGLVVCSTLVRLIPGACIYGFAKGVGGLGYRIAGKHRRIALAGLETAFGKEKTRKELEEITRLCFTGMATNAVELLFLLERPQLLRQRVSFRGQEHLTRALERGKGVILVSAHFGNFPLMLSKLSLEGYPTAGIMRPMRDSRVEKILAAKRARINLKTIHSVPRAACVNNTITALRNNELVFIPLDQNFGTAGVFVDFFGRKAATATGPVILAQRTKAALLPCFVIRNGDDTHTVIFEPPMPLEEGATPQDTIRINIQRLTDIIEVYIRRYPQEWGWIHRRWKSRSSAAQPPQSADDLI